MTTVANAPDLRSRASTPALELVVESRSIEADGVVSLVFRAPGGHALPAWEPGAHIDVCLPGMVRHYSLCGDPDNRETYRIAVLREPNGRGGSQFVHDSIRTGDRLEVGHPRNNFRLLESDRYLFVAGGIGITPILPMIAAASASGADWSLLYGGRSRGSMAFLGELETYGERVMVRPQDEYGLLDLEGGLGAFPEGLVYCCGPEALLGAVERNCRDWAPGRLQIERFAAKCAPAGAVSTEFEVHCADSGVDVSVSRDQSLLDALLVAGVDVNFDCREGTCGSCELEVLEGRPDHRDSIVNRADPETENVIFPCVSRAFSPRLVLDV
jgi:ferredoxin-NADP reductase